MCKCENTHNTLRSFEIKLKIRVFSTLFSFSPISIYHISMNHAVWQLAERQSRRVAVQISDFSKKWKISSF